MSHTNSRENYLRVAVAVASTGEKGSEVANFQTTAETITHDLTQHIFTSFSKLSWSKLADTGERGGFPQKGNWEKLLCNVLTGFFSDNYSSTSFKQLEEIEGGAE